MHKVDGRSPQALHSSEAARAIERAAQKRLPPHTLMARAGLAVAQLAMAIAPHARTVWLACGPGNNGGDGLEAAMHLQQWGKSPVVSWLGSPEKAPEDAGRSYQRAQGAGVTFTHTPPDQHDLCIDALLGLGAQARTLDGRLASWIRQINASSCPVLAVDLPTGLQADTGFATANCVLAWHTLSLLTLKPGLFTGKGRDAAGTVWLDRLGVDQLAVAEPELLAASAWLAGAPETRVRMHASHKGSYGDVIVIGGAPGMTGAALLAASGALHAGAGRTFVSMLDEGRLQIDCDQPELMFRPFNTLDLRTATVVSGCGGGEAIRAVLPAILATSASAVLDADALNTIAADTHLQSVLIDRGQRRAATVLTPHPLEAARLLGTTTEHVQHNRLAAAQQLAQDLDCVVVLKGSGTIIAAPGQAPLINATGNAKLASAGTGDVLAGMVGARMAAGLSAFQAAWQAVYRHGQIADEWPNHTPMTAAALARAAG